MDAEAKPTSKIDRIQPWQPSIAAVLGFSGVILAMLYNGHKDRAIKAEEEFRAAQATAYGIYLDLERIEGVLRSGEYGAYYAQNEMVERKSERFDFCMRTFELARESKIESLGITEAIKPNLGRLPPQIMGHYLAVLSRLDDVKRISRVSSPEQKLSCERRPISEVGSARYAHGGAVHAIGKFGDALVRQFPELKLIEQQRLSKPEYVPIEVRIANDRKIEMARLDESKAAIAKAEAEEAAEEKKTRKK